VSYLNAQLNEYLNKKFDINLPKATRDEVLDQLKKIIEEPQVN
jgi:hypothetical protein